MSVTHKRERIHFSHVLFPFSYYDISSFPIEKKSLILIAIHKKMT